jgi:2,3-bisphosphoglycerate-dependent phosphoglycerate mutase
VLLRHGESEWNAQNLFTGWVDVGLTEKGFGEAIRAGELMAQAGLLPDVLHTSLLKRAIATAGNAVATCDRQWIQVRRSWRLNERHYGDLQGKNKSQVREQYGDEKFMIWRRSFDTPPPPIAADAEFSQAGEDRYAGLAPDLVPATECLQDVIVRLLPYWYDAIVPDLLTHDTVLVVAHGNSLRAVVKHLDGISAEDIVGVNIPTGIPLVYSLDADLRPVGPARYLDPEAAAAAIDRVANQGR